MKFIILFSLLATAANAAQMQCDYSVTSNPITEYVCEGKLTTSRTDYFVDVLTGNHMSGKGNDDITTVSFVNTDITVLPKNLNVWFRNFFAIRLFDVQNYPNFRRVDFYDFTKLQSFYAGKLPLVTRIPRDTFWDLTKLRYLMLEEMPNMENLEADLLKNMPMLQGFSARGPNKINQISPGFFRFQGDSLTSVDFRDTNLARVGFTVFVNLQKLTLGRFENAGCINGNFQETPAAKITAAIRGKCQDFIQTENGIFRSRNVDTSDSRAEETQWQ